MGKIISASRRTDIPAFYGDWFMRRVEEGFAGWENPFGGQKILTSLRSEDVMAYVFWSKNYQPFMKHLQKVKNTGIPVMFNYTITGLPHIFECNLIEPHKALSNLKELSDIFSPEHVNWRYDPIVISNITDENFHLHNFRSLAENLSGYVTRCYFSFAIMYGKVERNFEKFQNENSVVISAPDNLWRLSLARKLTDIAQEYNIQMYTCCGDYLLADTRIKKAHCVDGDILKKLYQNCADTNERPTRKECGCTESTDIGKYDTCPHGCIYCYANINKERATKLFSTHDHASAFLGYSKNESDRFIEEIMKKKKPSKETVESNQLGLF